MNPTVKSLIEDDLVRHEGYVERVYLDSVGLKTFGVGHLVVPSDIEYTWPVDTPVSKVRIEQCFKQDLDNAIADCERLFPDLYVHPENVQRVLVNMTFNLGATKLKRFVRLREAISKRDYAKAAEEMVDSKWYGQVGRRSKELVRLMEWAHG